MRLRAFTYLVRYNGHAMLILYAEDDPEDAEVFCDALRAIDPAIICRVVTDGGKVIPFLETLEKLPDFIFLDINMPVITGQACLLQLQAHPRFRQIPVVMYTTSSRPVDKEECLRNGAAAFISKASTYSGLVGSLKTVLLTLPGAAAANPPAT